MIRVLNHLTWKVFAEFTHLSNVRGPCAAAVFKVGKDVTFNLQSDDCVFLISSSQISILFHHTGGR